MDDDRTGKIIDMASLRPVDHSAWFARLQKNRDGAPLPTVANAMMIFANDPRISDMLAYNAFTSQHLLMQSAPPIEDGGFLLPGPYPRSWGIEDIALVQGYLQRLWCPKFARSTVEDAMLAMAAVNQFHPVKDWVKSLLWDGKARIDLWLTNTFACENNEYHRAIGAKFLMAAIRRIMHPGCKFDHMMVLEGAQGIGKSRALRALFGDAWFSDAIPSDLSGRDAAMALLGIWCLEFAEIEHLIRAEVETIKAFLSRSVDRYRPPYGKAYVERPRQGVLVGTTNSDDYLRDSTGNRRIWPVRCKVASPEFVEVNREQLWAEAFYRESRGETIWLNDDEVMLKATIAQSDRLSEDMWTDPVATWLNGLHETRIPLILTEAIGIPKERQGKAQEMRIGAILRKLKWTKEIKRRGEHRRSTKLWFAPGTVQLEDEPETTSQGDFLN